MRNLSKFEAKAIACENGWEETLGASDTINRLIAEYKEASRKKLSEEDIAERNATAQKVLKAVLAESNQP